MITKQAIRKGVEVQCNGKTLTKEQIISKGENWSEQTEIIKVKLNLYLKKTKTKNEKLREYSLVYM